MPESHLRFYRITYRDIQTSSAHCIIDPAVCYRLLKYVATQTTLLVADTTVAPEKAVADSEKEMFGKYQDVMLRFLHDSSDRQMTALYALQSFCDEHNFPKGEFVSPHANGHCHIAAYRLLYNFHVYQYLPSYSSPPPTPHSISDYQVNTP